MNAPTAAVNPATNGALNPNTNGSIPQGAAPATKTGIHHMWFGDFLAAAGQIGHSLAKLGMLAKGGFMDLSRLGSIAPPSMNILAASKQVSPIKLGADFGGIGG
jgi:hypothetical protein